MFAAAPTCDFMFSRSHSMARALVCGTSFLKHGRAESVSFAGGCQGAAAAAGKGSFASAVAALCAPIGVVAATSARAGPSSVLAFFADVSTALPSSAADFSRFLLLSVVVMARAHYLTLLRLRSR